MVPVMVWVKNVVRRKDDVAALDGPAHHVVIATIVVEGGQLREPAAAVHGDDERGVFFQALGDDVEPIGLQFRRDLNPDAAVGGHCVLAGFFHARRRMVDQPRRRVANFFRERVAGGCGFLLWDESLRVRLHLFPLLDPLRHRIQHAFGIKSRRSGNRRQRQASAKDDQTDEFRPEDVIHFRSPALPRNFFGPDK